MVLGISLMAYFVDSDTKCFNVAVEFLSQNFYFIVLEMWNSDSWLNVAIYCKSQHKQQFLCIMQTRLYANLT